MRQQTEGAERWVDTSSERREVRSKKKEKVIKSSDDYTDENQCLKSSCCPSGLGKQNTDSEHRKFERCTSQEIQTH